MPKVHLPVDDYLEQIVESLERHSSVVVTAAPGAGKTTRVPPALRKVAKRKIAVLEPRRLAAIAAAHRIADEEGSAVGSQIGYEVRFDRKISSTTEVVFLTEALLSRKLLSDPILSDFDVVILDEFHERSLHTDTALALLYELQQLERSDLKIVVMSATLEAQKISDYLGGAPVVETPGQLFPLTVTYDTKPQGLLWNWDLAQRVVDKIKLAVREGQRDTLIFLPGVFEIDQVMKLAQAEKGLQDFLILPLHGRLDLQEQRRALQPQSRRKILLSTNVAESSVTVDGLDAVIDTGLERSSVFQMQSGFGRLTTHRISLASATQRAGRAARQFPGRCYKLWMPQDEKSFSDFSQPEIKTQDLTETLLFLLNQGVQDFQSFSWFEKPPAANLQFAIRRLESLHLVKDQRITDLGKKVLRNPMSIRLSLLVENFRRSGHEALGAWVAAFLSERLKSEPLRGSENEECDLIPLLSQAHREHFSRVKKAALQISPSSESWRWSEDQESALKLNLIRSYADRLGRRRQAESDRGLLASGRGVQLTKFSRVKKSAYFVALDGIDTEASQETQVSMASGVDEEFLKKNFREDLQEQREILWDEGKKTFLERKRLYLWRLPVGHETWQPASSEYIQTHLPDILLQNWNWLLSENSGLKSWWSRFRFYSEHVKPELQDFWNEAQLRSVLESASYGHKSLKSLADSDLIYFFENALGFEICEDLREKAPIYLEAAQGRKVPVNYEGEQAPSVELKLQHAFVWKKTPEVGNGIRVTVILLAPNMRPTQVTKDLEGFWKGSYAEVRKELKARYPKHDWPEKV
ncbi:MAG: ATP-dependent helicase HrpB [Bdellovibrionales bacterium]